MGEMSSSSSSSSLNNQIISYLRSRSSSDADASTTRKDIQTHLKNSSGDGDDDESSDSGYKSNWPKKDIKHALKQLAKQGAIVKDGKSYAVAAESSSDDDSSSSSSSSEGGGGSDSSDEHAKDALPLVPIAQLMRQTKQTEVQGGKEEAHDNNQKKVDLDDEIARLEAELAADDSNDDSESDDDDDGYSESDEEDTNKERRSKRISFGANTIHEIESNPRKKNKSYDDNKDDSPGIISLSDLANDRIEPLPQSALPQNKRRKLKIDQSGDGDNDTKKRKKRKRSDSTEGEEQQHTISEGLKSAVQDLLQNYVRPSHINRPPFYCRVCQHQSSSQEEFNTHKSTEFHVAAVQEEKKRSYCKLCRKQLTSVVQMEEHLKSKPHRDRMDYVKGKQRGLIGGARGRDVGGRGRRRSRAGCWEGHGRWKGVAESQRRREGGWKEG